ncbi:MAG: Hpt domain-containing protein [Nitrospirae bacterium]|nr:Hpt domain-containing protein [Nitrospirota bacterium]
MSVNPHEDQFLEEVLGLFSLEAQEWIRQIHAAVLELESGPAADRRPKLFDIILRGITNLGGSAATVELPAIERLAFALVPLVHGMRNHGGTVSVEQVELLRESLAVIASAIQNLAETRASGIFDLERIMQRIAAASAQIAPPAAAPVQEIGQQKPASSERKDAPAPSPSIALMEALLNLQQSRAQSLAPTRNMVEVVVRKAQGDSEQGASKIDGPTIMGILRELELQDTRFLEEVQQRLPRVRQALSVLEPGNSDAGAPNGDLKPILQEVHRLQEAAHTMDATAVMAFFRGLQTFLAIASQRRVVILPQRFKAIESRLGGVVPQVREWIEIGRVERAAIEQVLPHA